MTESTPTSSAWTRTLLGWGLILVGGALLLDRLHLVHLRGLSGLWPLLPIFVGVSLVASGEEPRRRRSGLLVLATGLWLLAASHNFMNLGYHDSWPLLLILLGLAMLAYPKRGDRAPGISLVLLGGLFLLATSGVLGLTPASLGPLALIAIGVLLMARGLARPRGTTGQDDPDSR